MSMTVMNILADPKKSWEQKAREIANEYDKIVVHNCWLMTKVSAMEARLVLWFGKSCDDEARDKLPK